MSDAPKRIWAMTVWGNEWTSGHWDQFDDCDGNVEYVRADELEEARREAWNAAIEAAACEASAHSSSGGGCPISDAHIAGYMGAVEQIADAIRSLAKPEAE